MSSKDVQNSLKAAEVNVHRSTIRRVLNKEGFNGHVARRMPLLSQKHCKMRLQFAMTNLDQSATFWKNVPWTDEMKIELFGHTSQCYVWCRKNEAFADKNIIPTVKHGGGSIMLWGCFATSDTGRFDFVEGRMNSEQYQGISAKNVSPSVQKLGLNRSWTFNKTMILNTQAGPNIPDFRSNITTYWPGLARVQTSILLKSFGEI